jgi:antitoxin component YwqK of YwqJK toxin-antitoxin module
MKKIALILLFISLSLIAGAQVDTSYKYVKFTYPSGEISSEGYLRNGKPDGYWKAYYESGQLKSEGNRLNQKLDSTWKFYDAEGNIRSIINYKEGKQNGYRYTYLENEYIEEYFENNVKERQTKVFYNNGSIKKTIPFEAGLENGLALTYNTDSIIILIEEYRKGFLISREIINRTDRNGAKQGLWKYFYETGKLMQEVTYLNDKKNGFLKRFDETGTLVSIEKYINDVLQTDVSELKEYDIRRDYYPNGNIKIQGSYYNNKPDGIRREYDEEGNIIKGYVFLEGVLLAEGIVDENGKRQGAWKEYYSNGALMSEGIYKNSIRVGNWKYYHENGNLEQEGKYTSREIPDGDWKYYHENGQLYRIESYMDGELDGEYIEYNDSGKVLVKGQYTEGFETGPWEYYIGDVIQKGAFLDGAENDWWVYTSVPDGKIIFKGKYFDGKPDGKHTWYYPNGKKKLEGNYELGIRTGDWKYYDEYGSLFLIITYKQGIEIKYNNVIIKPEISSTTD